MARSQASSMDTLKSETSLSPLLNSLSIPFSHLIT